MTSLEPANYITDQSFLYYDAETMPFKNKFISHFALSDALMASAGRHQQPMIHFWPTSNLVILGMMDTKLPYFSDALAVLKAAGKDTIVRNSGGLAVIGDEGILNFSIILPERERIPIDDGYAIMLLLVDMALKQYGKTIEAYEIKESYCPGDFDLSIDGKKIAGIAQRRLKNGIAIMIYISVTGNQKERAELIREFYQAGLNNETVKWHYPKINPSVMATLEDLLEVHMTVDELKELILNSLGDLGASLSKGTYTEEIIEDYQSAFQKMIRRNEQMLGDYLDRRLLDEPNV